MANKILLCPLQPYVSIWLKFMLFFKKIEGKSKIDALRLAEIQNTYKMTKPHWKRGEWEKIGLC